jgi:hypothetical protein
MLFLATKRFLSAINLFCAIDFLILKKHCPSKQWQCFSHCCQRRETTPSSTGGIKRLQQSQKRRAQSRRKLLKEIKPPSTINVVWPPHYKVQGGIIDEKR